MPAEQSALGLANSEKSLSQALSFCLGILEDDVSWLKRECHVWDVVVIVLLSEGKHPSRIERS